MKQMRVHSHLFHVFFVLDFFLDLGCYTTHAYTYIHAFVCIHLITIMYVCMRVCIHMYIHLYTHTHAKNMDTYMFLNQKNIQETGQSAPSPGFKKSEQI